MLLTIKSDWRCSSSPDVLWCDFQWHCPWCRYWLCLMLVMVKMLKVSKLVDPAMQLPQLIIVILTDVWFWYYKCHIGRLCWDLFYLISDSWRLLRTPLKHSLLCWLKLQQTSRGVINVLVKLNVKLGCLLGVNWAIVTPEQEKYFLTESFLNSKRILLKLFCSCWNNWMVLYVPFDGKNSILWKTFEISLL